MSTQAVTKTNNFLPSLFDDFFKPWKEWVTDFNGGRALAPLTVPAVNISEDKDSYKVSMACPGIKKEDLKIDVDGKVLTISAESEETKEEKEKTYSRQEYNYSSFSRSFTLPETVQLDKIEAHYDDGVLKLKLPKKEEVKQASQSMQVKVQ
ncbi:Hsp20/alpha crystallin family protein [Chitinophaga vietnamensis]|uniref:Hsp20/alpha crystallin family protein n=1 Tax=Chitinophaga vietnamensis TaxID=2593957 RepID=UPI0011778467|nr:Hsp20/alpha crystallin family protein [Chitinophaga vietnamensis]